jgi:PAS domain-containing protein
MTLMESTPLKFAPPWVQVLITILMGILGLGFGSWSRPNSPWRRLGILLIFPLVWVTSAAFIIRRMGTVPPIVAPATVFAGVYGLFLIRHHASMVRTTQTLAARLAQVMERVGTLRQIEAADPLAVIIENLQRVVPFEDAFVFVLPDNSRHLKFLWSWHAAESAILERRRDVNRKGWLQVGAGPAGDYLHRFFRDHETSDAFGVPVREFDRIVGMLVLKLEKGQVLTLSQRRYLVAAAPFIGPLLKTPTPKTKTESQSLLMHPESIALAVHEQVMRYKNALEHLPVGVLVADPIGRVHYINGIARKFAKRVGVQDPLTEIYPLLRLLCRNTPYTPAQIVELTGTEEESISIPWQDPATGRPKEIAFHSLVINLPDPTETVSNLLQVSIY